MTSQPITVSPALRNAAVVFGIVVVGLLPWLGVSNFWIRQLTLILFIALIASGLNLSLGFAGELSLGQAGFYASGAYMTGYLAKNVVNEIALALILSAGVALIVGLLVGGVGIRLGGWVLAITSLFLIMLLPDVIILVGEPLGNLDGLSGIPRPEFVGFELQEAHLYAVTVGIAAVWFWLFARLARSAHGGAFRVLSEGRTLSSSLGLSAYRLKLTAYAIGALPAGLAGCLYAYLDGYISPHSFGLELTIVILAASVLGGLHSVYGAILGAALLQLLPLLSGEFSSLATIVYGALLIVGGVLLPRGLGPTLHRYIGRQMARVLPSQAAAVQGEAQLDKLPRLEGEELRVRDLHKSFGGAHVIRGVSMTARPGEITALIGPNGSGKTTLLNLISGFVSIDEGTVSIGSDDISQRSPRLRALAGLGRTFQTPTIPGEMSVQAVSRSGALWREASILATMLGTGSYRRREREARANTRACLEALGIDSLASQEAASLPLGTRRLVELARAIESSPRVLLLDEIASGLDPEEVVRLSEVIRALRATGVTIVLVEHNFDLITMISDHIVVLAEGQVLAEGSVEDIAASEAVRTTYLGSGPTPRDHQLSETAGASEGI